LHTAGLTGVPVFSLEIIQRQKLQEVDESLA